MATTTDSVPGTPAATGVEIWQVDDPNIHLTLAPNGLAFLNDLLRDTRESPEALIRKALGLYRLAIDAQHEGKAIGAASRPENLDEQFVL